MKRLLFCLRMAAGCGILATASMGIFGFTDQDPIKLYSAAVAAIVGFWYFFRTYH